MSKILAAEGSSLPVGAPIAILRDASLAEAESSGSGGAGESAGKLDRCPTTDVYDDSQPRVKVLEWQAYRRDAAKGGGSGDGGCMGG